MRRVIVPSLLVVILGSLVPASPAPGEDFYVVTFDAGTFYPGGDDRPIPLTIPQGAKLWYQNLHVSVFHNLQHRVARDEDVLFASATMPAWNLSRGIDPVPVVGVEDLEPGDYPFYCYWHPLMRGTLHVV